MNHRYGWSSIVVLAIVGLAGALSLSVAVPMALRTALVNSGDVDASLLQPIVSLASAMLAFAGVGISGLIGLQVLRRDRVEGHDAEARAVAAALSGECRDISTMFGARGDYLKRKLEEEQGDPLTINLGATYPLPTIIYEAVAPRIGLLGVKLAQSTVLRYGRALAWKAETEVTRSRERWLEAKGRQYNLAVEFKNYSEVLARFAGLPTEEKQ